MWTRHAFLVCQLYIEFRCRVKVPPTFFVKEHGLFVLVTCKGEKLLGNRRLLTVLILPRLMKLGMPRNKQKAVSVFFYLPLQVACK